MKFAVAWILLLLPTLAHTQTPLIGDTDTYPSDWAVESVRGSRTESGRIPAPWSARFEGTRSSGRVRFGKDPVHGRPAFELVNLDNESAARLVTDPPIPLEAGASYVLSLDLLTRGEAVGSLRLTGAIRKTLPLPPTRGSWIPLRETFTAGEEPLRLEFVNNRSGEANSLHVSRIRIEAEAPTPIHESPTPRPSALRDAYLRDYAPIGGVSFLNTPDPDAITRSATGGSLIEVAGQPFAAARRFTVEQTGATPQASRLTLTNRNPILKGETLMMVFYARGELLPGGAEDGWGPVIQAVIHGPDDVPGAGPGSWQWSEPSRVQDLRAVWQRFHAPARWEAPRDLQPGEIRFEIWIGQKPQQVEIGGIALLSIKSARRDRLPVEYPTHSGAAKDASWRAEARERIERDRKAELRVLVRGADTASVGVAMKSHRFHLGSAVWAATFHGMAPNRNRLSPVNTDLYRTRSMAYFNRVTIEDAFGAAFWAGANPATLQQPLEEVIEYYRQRNVGLAGGPLWLPGTGATNFDSEELERRIRAAGGRVADWTVVSETGSATHPEFPTRLLAAFRLAAEVQPEARLWLEEIDARHALTEGSFPRYFPERPGGWAGWLREQNVPLYGLALHATGGILRDIPPERWWRLMDLVRERHDLSLRFTRLHIPLRDPRDPHQREYQLDHLRDTLITLFAHPAVDGVDFAGFWAGAHPHPASALWNENWELTPLGILVNDLFYKEWWSSASGETADGVWSARLFQGTHEITVTHPDGRVLRRTVTLDERGLTEEFAF